MALLGDGAMVFWHDIVGDDGDYNHWHGFEHMPERVGIDGFHRGRPYRAHWAGPEYFNMYETRAPDTLTSPAYLERLNDPTPWTKSTLGAFRNSNRTLCRIASSHGKGTGGYLLTVRLSPGIGAGTGLAAALSDTILPELVTGPAVVGAHLLRADESASRVETEEKALRDAPDEVADWVVLVEAMAPVPLETLLDEDLSEAALGGHGATGGQLSAIYRLLHILHGDELA